MLDRCNEFLRALLGSDALIQLWWSTQNRAFQFQTPQEVFDADPQKVLNYLLRMLSDEYS